VMLCWWVSSSRQFEGSQCLGIQGVGHINPEDEGNVENHLHSGTATHRR
jgi:hypothetical protein